MSVLMVKSVMKIFANVNQAQFCEIYFGKKKKSMFFFSAWGSKKCLKGSIASFVDYLATKQSQDLFLSKLSFNWHDSYTWSESNKWNLYAPKNLFDLVYLLEFVAKNNLAGPYWVNLKKKFFKKFNIFKIGGIKIHKTNFLVDNTEIPDGPW